MKCANGVCVFNQEVNYAGLQGLGATLNSLQNGGKKVEFTFHYDLRARVSTDNLLGMLQRENGELYIQYDNETLEGADIIKKTKKPMWGFNLSENGKSLVLTRQ